MRGIQRWWQEITGLVLPVGCAGCGLPRSILCEWCRAVLSGGEPRRVRPSPEPAGLPHVHAAAPYGGEVRAVLLAHKERGAMALARPLGDALAGAIRACSGARGGLLLVPIPSARRAVAARGHDPTRRVARAAAAVLRRGGRPARVVAVLRQRRAVADQSGLTAPQRLGNLAGALAVPESAAGLLGGGSTGREAASVVLVDDLMTTGASLVEGARAVTEAGGRVAGAAVVAAPLTAFRPRAVRGVARGAGI
ncbi:ComF family protein [Streptomyces sp. NPDC051776]|uniref:ComF family protein n=1 Tax=Streptomyces sp. NPDC051776 TaxID=3155414 RepID=UPI0034369CD1